MFMKTIREKIEDIVNKPVEMGGVYYMKDIIDDLEALFKEEEKMLKAEIDTLEDIIVDCKDLIEKLKTGNTLIKPMKKDKPKFHNGLPLCPRCNEYACQCEDTPAESWEKDFWSDLVTFENENGYVHLHQVYCLYYKWTESQNISFFQSSFYTDSNYP